MRHCRFAPSTKSVLIGARRPIGPKTACRRGLFRILELGLLWSSLLSRYAARVSVFGTFSQTRLSVPKLSVLEPVDLGTVGESWAVLNIAIPKLMEFAPFLTWVAIKNSPRPRPRPSLPAAAGRVFDRETQRNRGYGGVPGVRGQLLVVRGKMVPDFPSSLHLPPSPLPRLPAPCSLLLVAPCSLAPRSCELHLSTSGGLISTTIFGHPGWPNLGLDDSYAASVRSSKKMRRSFSASSSSKAADARI